MLAERKGLDGPLVLVRGAGELATGVGWALFKAGYRVVHTEIQSPLMVRWPVCFGTAVWEQTWEVEGIRARLVKSATQLKDVWQAGELPVLVDPELGLLTEIKPSVLIDAIMAKRNLGTNRAMAPFTVGLGPGFRAGTDVDVVIETNRGHDLARLINNGEAEPNTGIPGEIGGVAADRVIYSPQAGIFKAKGKIGDRVAAGQTVGTLADQEVKASIPGVLRGLLCDGTYVQNRVKIGDVDPRGRVENCWTISEKARAIGMAALLALCEREHMYEDRSC